MFQSVILVREQIQLVNALVEETDFHFHADRQGRSSSNLSDFSFKEFVKTSLTLFLRIGGPHASPAERLLEATPRLCRSTTRNDGSLRDGGCC